MSATVALSVPPDIHRHPATTTSPHIAHYRSQRSLSGGSGSHMSSLLNKVGVKGLKYTASVDGLLAQGPNHANVQYLAGSGAGGGSLQTSTSSAARHAAPANGYSSTSTASYPSTLPAHPQHPHHQPPHPPSSQFDNQPTGLTPHSHLDPAATNRTTRASNGDSSISSPVSSTFSGMSAHSTAASSQTPQAAPLPNVGTRSYTVLKEVGDGSFGTVWLVDWHSPLTLPPGTMPPGPSSRPEYKGKRLVALKKMKKAFDGGWDEAMQLKELKSLRSIPMHPYVIPLYDAWLDRSTRELYFVFECMEGNLYQLTKTRKGRPLAGGLIASIFKQTLLGLHHIHTCGYFHRDMKPENLLITTTGLADFPHGSPLALPTAPPETDVVVVVKIADFGLARETKSRPPYTEYVSTRWYRAPEVLLRSRDYSNPVDIWALGAIMAETITLKPLFPGTTEMDQVHRIVDILGDPKNGYGRDDKGRMRGGGQWKQGVALADAVGFQWPDKQPLEFMRLFDLTAVPIQLIDCIHEMLFYDPAARFTTGQCLSHAYFRDVEPRLRPYAPPPPPQPAHLPIAPVLSSNGFARPTLPVPSNPLSPPQSSHMTVDVSPRTMPSSHAHGALAQAKPPFGARQGDGDSVMSESDRSGYSMPIMPPYYGGYVNCETSGHNPYMPGHPVIPSDKVRRPSDNSSFYDGSYQVSGSNYSFPVVTAPSDSTISPCTSLPSLGETSVQGEQQSPQKGRRLANLFSGGSHSTSVSLKRSPSEHSTHEQAPPPPQPIDPKKAKKEAEKAAKDAAKAESQAKREQQRLAAQQRSRAVMAKQQRLAQTGANDMVVDAQFANPVPVGVRKVPDKGKGRAVMSPPLPPVSEDGSRLRPLDATRFRSRRRGEDDADVHSVSSNETGPDERRFSIASGSTMDSDPGPARPRVFPHLHHSPSHSSMGSASRLAMASSPNLAGVYRASTPASTTSSLDHQFIATMAGLTAEEQEASLANSARPSEDSGHRSDGRYSPYPPHSAHHPQRPVLPGIQAFDFPKPGSFSRGSGHDRNQSVSSGHQSILSTQSMPISFHKQQTPPPLPYRQLLHSQPTSPLYDGPSPVSIASPEAGQGRGDDEAMDAEAT